ncbi:MAG: CTP synthase [bacterium]|nr:CTP synthase [bacterium]
MPKAKQTKYIFVTGGVLSGLGKGITAASIGNILKARGFSIYMQKFDQYLNVDAGTLNPGEHGECFVTDDGAETDLDLGHYERFTDTSLSKNSSIMTGQIYQSILEKERNGQFLGKTIQVIPHVTNEVKERIKKAAKESDCDILITEIGGTIGDYEGMHFIEAIRQMPYDVGHDNVLYVHVGFLPYLEVTEELKSKPIQNSVHDLQAMGIHPDVIMCRADHVVSENILKKVALFCGVDKDAVIPLETVQSVYEVPLILEKYQLDKLITKKLCLPDKNGRQDDWANLVKKIKAPKNKKVTIGLVGKYMGMKDTYLSITEAVKAAAFYYEADLDIQWIDSEEVEKKGTDLLKKVDGILVPGGFGNRGIEGKITAAKYARENNIPYLGLCLGLQIAVIEFARNVCNLKGAHSTEMDPKTPYPVIHIMPEQEKLLEGNQYGGTMRLGAYPCILKDKSKALELYGEKKISERHRHRYEVNNKYRSELEKCGLVFSGTSPSGHLAEIIELPNNRFFMASQFHPEFKSRPNRPHPLFAGFIKATIKS